jgi:dTDP-4-amino-4,6-dideoxygalactose transaminase
MRLDELQAGFLVIKLKYLDRWNNERRKIADIYIKNLSSVKEVILPLTNKDSTHVYHIFNIRIKDRDELAKHLHKSNIQTLIHYPIPPHLQKATSYLGYKKGDFPIAEELADTSLSLPIWPGMSYEEVIYVAQEIKKFYNEG